MKDYILSLPLKIRMIKRWMTLVYLSNFGQTLTSLNIIILLSSIDCNKDYTLSVWKPSVWPWNPAQH